MHCQDSQANRILYEFNFNDFADTHSHGQQTSQFCQLLLMAGSVFSLSQRVTVRSFSSLSSLSFSAKSLGIFLKKKALDNALVLMYLYLSVIVSNCLWTRANQDLSITLMNRIRAQKLLRSCDNSKYNYCSPVSQLVYC